MANLPNLLIITDDDFLKQQLDYFKQSPTEDLSELRYNGEIQIVSDLSEIDKQSYKSPDMVIFAPKSQGILSQTYETTKVMIQEETQPLEEQLAELKEKYYSTFVVYASKDTLRSVDTKDFDVVQEKSALFSDLYDIINFQMEHREFTSKHCKGGFSG